MHGFLSKLPCHMPIFQHANESQGRRTSELQSVIFMLLINSENVKSLYTNDNVL